MHHPNCITCCRLPLLVEVYMYGPLCSMASVFPLTPKGGFILSFGNPVDALSRVWILLYFHVKVVVVVLSSSMMLKTDLFYTDSCISGSQWHPAKKIPAETLIIHLWRFSGICLVYHVHGGERCLAQQWLKYMCTKYLILHICAENFRKFKH